MAKASKTSKVETKEIQSDVVTVTDPKVEAAAIEKMITARISLLFNAPFFGNMATRMKLVNADDWCSTAATDGRNFFYNTEFISKLRQKEIEFLFGHELLHACYDHMGRRGTTRDAQLFNIACDYVVNADLFDAGLGEKITTVPCLFDTQYAGMCAEQVYDILYEKADKIDMNSLIDQLLDDHIDGEGDDEGEGKDGEGKDGEGKGKGKGRPKLTEEEKKQLRDEIKEAMISAAHAVGAGNTPGGVKRLISDFTTPVMNWRELLQQHVESQIKADFTWMRPSRRSWHCDAVMPGMKPGDRVEVTVAIDTSGSISAVMLKEFLSEVKGIMDAFDDYEVRVMSFDTQVHNVQVFTPESSDDILSYEPMGGGGTDFMAVWEYFVENDIVPKKLAVITDGYPNGSFGDPEYCDTLFVIHGSTSIVAPFGITTYLSEGS